VILVLPFPPSVNRYWRHPSSGRLAGRHLISEEGRRYRSAIQAIVASSHVPHTFHGHRVCVSLEVIPPDRRKRDLDNLPKSIFDGLTHAGIWDDDGQIDDLRIWRSTRKANIFRGEVIVTIERMEDVAAMGERYNYA
jgi:crossover junction endodeoxyribonuclease RusA